MTNQVSTQENTGFKTGLVKIQDTFAPMIQDALTGNGINMDDYQKTCVLNAITAINAVIEGQGLSWNAPNFDRNNVTDTLLKVAALKLNATATPREVFFQLRNVKRKVDDKDIWMKQVEMGIEGDGNDALLANFGRDVETIHQFWLVRENDKFEYPTFKGIEFSPPVWTPTGQGKVVRVVYPITKKSGNVEYYISERADVIRNLIAHVKQNLINETFGIAQDRYKATAEQKKQIDKKKNEIFNKIENLGLDGALADEEIAEHISPAWKDPQSREAMIIRKMRNNIVKKIPKDFGSAFMSLIDINPTETEEQRVRKEIYENANQELIDIEPVTEIQNEQHPTEQTIVQELKGNIQDAEFVEVQQQKEVSKHQEPQQTLFDGPDF